MSEEERIRTVLTEVENEMKGRRYVAITGFSGVGKTVFLTLLNHALDGSFLDQHPEVNGHVASGRPILETWETSMLDGEFPKKTQLSTRDDIVIEMSGKGLTSTTSHIHLPDISGEDFKTMCIEDVGDEERLLQVLDMAKTKGKTHGLMSYVPLSDMYLILLDCSKISEWEKLAIRHVQFLTAIRAFKKVMKKTKGDKIDNPIGIILTKSDKLEDPDIPASEIVHTHMKRFYNTLESIHSGERKFFKVHVDVERDGNNEVADVEPKVKKPLTYSHNAYADVLWWIHQNISG